MVFRLKQGRRDAGRFVYALACRVEQWTEVEVVSLQVGDLHYQKEVPTEDLTPDRDDLTQGAEQ